MASKIFAPFLVSNSDYYHPMDDIHPGNWIAPNVHFDANEVPRVDYGGYIGIQYNPTTIGQYALSCYNEWLLTGASQWLQKFLIQIEWFVNNQQTGAGGGVAYTYDFPLEGYDLPPGWISSLSQGLALSCIKRAYTVLQDASLKILANGIYETMRTAVSEGGTMAVTPEGGIWFEEAPVPSGSLILNGHLTAVIGLYDYTQLIPIDAESSALLVSALESTLTSIPMYDNGAYLIYDRMRFAPISEAYKHIHVFDMLHLYQVTRDNRFLQIWKRWAAY